MRNCKSFLLAVCLILITGCAAQQQSPIAFSSDSLPEASRVGIAMSDIPKVQTTYPGADCLLCLATAAAVNSSLSKQVQTYSADEFMQVKDELKEKLESQGYVVSLVDESVNVAKLPKFKSKEVNTAKKDFSSYKKTNQFDYLVVVDLNFVGVQRNYSSYIPTGDPQAVIYGATYMVNLENNSYVWYKPLKIFRSAEGEWDEPPTFPGVTNAFYQVLEQARDAVTEPFKSPELVSALH